MKIILLCVFSLFFIGATGKKPLAKNVVTQHKNDRLMPSYECKQLAKKVCTMQYLPTTCKVEFKKEKGKKPIYVKGGNACQARANLEKKFCEKGLSIGAQRADLKVTCIPAG